MRRMNIMTWIGIYIYLPHISCGCVGGNGRRLHSALDMEQTHTHHHHHRLHLWVSWAVHKPKPPYDGNSHNFFYGSFIFYFYSQPFLRLLAFFSCLFLFVDFSGSYLYIYIFLRLPFFHNAKFVQCNNNVCSLSLPTDRPFFCVFFHRNIKISFCGWRFVRLCGYTAHA